MSSVIPIENIPNQSLSITLDNIRYDLRFRNVGVMMILDLTINDEPIITGIRVVGGLPIISEKYLKCCGGNFIFLTELGDIVSWDKFGITQTLIYLTVDELELLSVL
jgi:hypothetical protein